jgi:hypothetical protein
MSNNILNTVSTFIKNISWTPLRLSILGNIVLVGIIVFLFTNNKTPEPRIIIKDRIVNVEGKAGKLDTIYEPKYISKINPINTALLKRYNALKLKDSVIKDSMFSDAITERDYNEVYEDKIVKISVYTKVQGKLLKQASNYFVKPSTIVIKDTTSITYNKPLTNKLLVGLETGLQLNLFTKKENTTISPVVKANVYFQNKRGNIITSGISSDKVIWAGYIIIL